MQFNVHCLHFSRQCTHSIQFNTKVGCLKSNLIDFTLVKLTFSIFDISWQLKSTLQESRF